MRFDIITLFPEVITPYINSSIIGRAVKNKLIKVRVHDLRKFGEGKRRTVDERAYGGGPGMVLKAEPLLRAVQSLKLKSKKSKVKIIIFEAGGKQFDEIMSQRFSKQERIIMICGHYEGIDARVAEILRDIGFAVEEVSIGPYVLTGGELPALVLIDAVSRKIKGVLGKHDSLEEKRLGVGVPIYTRPEKFKHGRKSYNVPKVLLSGHHKEIEKWRKGRI